ncbi:MAG TPA: M24 family metallopeptidase [Chloroflexota bacterium]|nr:M24 family metallopeptidase [Chloroflexota bacterium]
MTRESLSASPLEMVEKEQRVRHFLADQKLDGLVLTTQSNFAWFTCGGDSHVGIGTDNGSVSILVTPDAKYVLCDNVEAPRFLNEELAGQGFEFRVFNWWEGGPSDEIAKLVSGPVGADTPIPGTTLVAGKIPPLRYSLTAPEIERYRWLGKATGECLSEAAHEIRPGMTEHEIAAVLGGKIMSRGIIPQLVLIAVDERISKYRHPIPTDKTLDRYAMLVAGAKKWGLVVSATRIVHFGAVPCELKQKHDAVMAVDAEFIANTRPGTSVDYIFRKGMAAYERAGYPEEWHLHHQGGPTGYAGRDYRVKPGIQESVQPNQAFAWNPTITGTKCEDTIIVLNDRTEIISAYGDWPMVPIEAESMTIVREDILEL